jgi:glycosyltransferase involved in cell wall biosynthesis
MQQGDDFFLELSREYQGDLQGIRSSGFLCTCYRYRRIQMNILLVGDYLPSRQYSMQLFVEIVHKGLRDAGLQVRVAHPLPFFGRIWPYQDGFGKWIGYIDKFLLFPVYLSKIVKWADIIHICDHANSVYIPFLKGKPHVITCHDMIAIRSALGEIAEVQTSITGKVYQRWILRSLCKASKIVCVSQNTANDLIKITGLPRCRISIASMSLNYDYRPMEPNQAHSRLHRLGLDPDIPFFLHVGGNSWYKNREGVLRIFRYVKKMDGYKSYRMVMVGNPFTAEQKSLIAELKISAHVLVITDVSCEDLRALYSMAKALVFPSLYEGFGWPIIEAQACGCPVFTTDRNPMNQTGGSAAIYINPTDEQKTALVIARKLNDSGSIMADGLMNVRSFSKKAMIDNYLTAYQSAINQKFEK